MAVIDVDRHILSQIVTIQLEIKRASAKYAIEWNKIIEVRDKTDALFSHPPKGSGKDFEELKRRIYRATRKADVYANEIAGMIYKQEALLMHLVSEIKEADSRKGRETNAT